MTRPADPPRACTQELVASAFAAAAGVGPFFAVDPWTAGAGWRPLSELITDKAVLAERVASARSVLASHAAVHTDSVEPRVAASMVFLGLSARLLSPALATAVLTETVPALIVDSVWWRPVPSGPWPVAVSPVPGQGTGGGAPDAAAQLLAAHVLDTVVAPVLAAFTSVSRHVLWGNVTSALGGALGMIAAAHPDRAESAARIAEALLRIPPLAGTGALVQPRPENPRRFLLRRSCCLYYRIPGGGLCGDCVLMPEETRRAQWLSQLDH